MHKLSQWLQHQPPWRLIVLGIALCLGLGYLDRRATPAASFSFFYVLTIAMVAWGAGRRAGLLTALIATTVLVLDESMVRPTPKSFWILWWNAGVRLGVFAVISYLVAAVRDMTRTLQQRVSERMAELQTANTALHRSKQELEAKSQILRSVSKSIGEGIVVADKSGRLVLFNPAAEDIIGMGAVDMPASEWSSAYGAFLPDTTTLFPADELPLARALRGEKSDGVEMFIRNSRRPEGVYISVCGRPLLTEEGEHWGGVIALRDISERKTMERQILAISDREQARIGQDLHDGLCQELVGIAFLAAQLERRLATGDAAVADKAHRIGHALDDAISKARGIARGLYPVRLESNGLTAALQELADNVNGNRGVRCEFDSANPVHIEDNALATQLFRIAQEAVTNALRHAAASQITLCLERNGTGLRLSVADNGRGFERPASPHPGMGLEIMAYRARTIRGSLVVEKPPEGGTIVSCTVTDLPQLA